jgi:hypothetical protein
VLRKKRKGGEGPGEAPRGEAKGGGGVRWPARHATGGGGWCWVGGGRRLNEATDWWARVTVPAV